MKFSYKRRRRMVKLCIGCLFVVAVDGFAFPSPSRLQNQGFANKMSNTPGDDMISAGLIATQKVDDDERTESSSLSQVLQYERINNDTMRRLRRSVITRRRREINEQEDEDRSREDYVFILVAIVPCVLAFIFWENISYALASFIDEHGAIGRTVDGREFANSLIRPTITGVVVPVISIAMATLLSNTVNILRERQVTLRALINKEACDIRLLRRAIFGMFGTRQHAGRRSRALALVTSYVDQLDKECQKGAIDILEELELSGGIATNELDRLSAMLHGVEGAAASRQGSVAVADDIIARLNEYRSDRVALLLTDFPDLHWVVLIALSVSICVTFLLESNQALNQYLNSIQLRSLFALLVGVFSATATLCIDLVDPFTGSFSIVAASAQIGDMKLCLQEDIREANAEDGEFSSRTVKSFRTLFHPIAGLPLTKNDNSEDDDQKLGSSPTPTRYSMLSTIYFHLLTGPLGSNVRAMGDILAWFATIVTKRIRWFLAWKRWTWMNWNRSPPQQGS